MGYRAAVQALENPRETRAVTQQKPTAGIVRSVRQTAGADSPALGLFDGVMAHTGTQPGQGRPNGQGAIGALGGLHQ